jgi:hypothetical protein
MHWYISYSVVSISKICGVGVPPEYINAVKSNKQKALYPQNLMSIDFSIQYTKFSNFRCA